MFREMDFLSTSNTNPPDLPPLKRGDTPHGFIGMDGYRCLLL